MVNYVSPDKKTIFAEMNPKTSGVKIYSGFDIIGGLWACIFGKAGIAKCGDRYVIYSLDSMKNFLREISGGGVNASLSRKQLDSIVAHCASQYPKTGIGLTPKDIGQIVQSVVRYAAGIASQKPQILGQNSEKVESAEIEKLLEQEPTLHVDDKELNSVVENIERELGVEGIGDKVVKDTSTGKVLFKGSPVKTDESGKLIFPLGPVVEEVVLKVTKPDSPKKLDNVLEGMKGETSQKDVVKTLSTLVINEVQKKLSEKAPSTGTSPGKKSVEKQELKQPEPTQSNLKQFDFESNPVKMEFISSKKMVPGDQVIDLDMTESEFTGANLITIIESGSLDRINQVLASFLEEDMESIPQDGFWLTVSSDQLQPFCDKYGIDIGRFSDLKHLDRQDCYYLSMETVMKLRAAIQADNPNKYLESMLQQEKAKLEAGIDRLSEAFAALKTGDDPQTQNQGQKITAHKRNEINVIKAGREARAQAKRSELMGKIQPHLNDWLNKQGVVELSVDARNETKGHLNSIMGILDSSEEPVKIFQELCADLTPKAKESFTTALQHGINERRDLLEYGQLLNGLDSIAKYMKTLK